MDDGIALLEIIQKFGSKSFKANTDNTNDTDYPLININ